MRAIIVLKESISGYWNGGTKRRFEIELDRNLDGTLNIRSDNKGSYIKVHCYGANHYWHVALGKTEKQTLSYGVRHFNRKLIDTVEYINN